MQFYKNTLFITCLLQLVHVIISQQTLQCTKALMSPRMDFVSKTSSSFTYKLTGEQNKKKCSYHIFDKSEASQCLSGNAFKSSTE
eukprot:Awhi_evm1s15634